MGTRRSDREIALKLIETGSVKKTAEVLRMSEAAVYTRKRKPQFQKIYTELLDTMLESTTARLQAGAITAADTLISVMSDPAVNHQTRSNAAASLLSNLLKFREATDIIQRLEALESKANVN